MKKALPILLLLVLPLFTLDPLSVYPSSGISGTSIWVTTDLDILNESDGYCTLREAVIAANTDTASGDVDGECEAGDGVDTIILGARTHLLQIDGADEFLAETGDLDIRESVNIYGVGKDLTIIDAVGITDRVFHVPGGFDEVTLRLADLTITNGTINDGDDSGAAVKSESGLLDAEDVIFKDNTVVGTASGAAGGAIMAKDEMLIVNCLFSNNYAHRGGAVFIAGGVTGARIEKSLFLGNSAQYGGAITSYGQLTIQNTTFSQNSALYAGGGAINNLATMTIEFSTLVGNKSDGGVLLGRAGALDNGPSATINVRATILAGNSAAYSPEFNNCNQGGTWDTTLYNLEDDDTCPFGPSNLYNTPPKLAPLGFYGGPTQTYPVLHDSEAIDNGGNTLCPDDDQRSYTRPIDGNNNGTVICDVGAFEAESQYHVVYMPLVIK